MNVMYYTLDTHDIQYIYNNTNEHRLGNKDWNTFI